jgi:hypothetical protein
MSEQPYSRNSAEERCVDWFQPIRLRAVLGKLLKNLVSARDQLSAVRDVSVLTRIDLTDRRVSDVSRFTQELSEEIDGFTNVTVDESD